MAGANLGLPFLIINLGGEMIYILNQRLTAQQIPYDKADKVRIDVIRHLFSDAFIEELMRPQPLYSMTSTRQTFDKLAHSSIMKLQTSSMNKLFDLMIMGVKMQILCVKYPEEILQITLNHLKELNSMIRSPESQAILNKVIDRLKERYQGLSSAVMGRIRQSLLKFFQNRYAKVTLLLSRGIQLQDGTIKLSTNEGVPGGETPGKIQKYSQNGEVIREYPRNLIRTQTFTPTRYSSRFSENSTTLGFNLYSSDKPFPPPPQEENKSPAPVSTRRYVNTFDKQRADVAKWEINELANMIITEDESSDKFELNLNFNLMDVEQVGEVTVREVIGKHVQNEALSKMTSEFEINESTHEDPETDELMDLIN